MKTKAEEIELLLSYVNELQESGCHETAFNVASMAMNRLKKLVQELELKIDPNELP